MHKPDLSAVDQCVMCGMCQPHCPTYKVQPSESESPRGRISMILGLAQQQLEPDPAVIQHLYNCTSCGACESVCPSRVPFLQLMDEARQLIKPKTRRSLSLSILLTLTKRPSRYKTLGYLMRSKWLGAVLRKTRLLSSSSYYLQKALSHPSATAEFASFYPATSTQSRGNIALFTGCITRLFDQTTINDTILLLTRCGYNVHIPPQQACCGALHQHNGEIETAEELATQNQKSLDLLQYDAIIGTASGCTAQLIASQRVNGNWQRPVLDIMQFIDQQQLLQQLELNPINAHITLHTPCTQRALFSETRLQSLLCKIPESQITHLPSNTTCCGAGGSQLLEPTEASEPLRQIKLDDISQLQPDIIVSSNYGCALNLASGLLQSGLSQNKQIDIVHPVSLLVKSASLK